MNPTATGNATPPREGVTSSTTPFATLSAIHPTPADSRFFRFRVGLLRSDAYAAVGKPDSAKLILQALQQEFGPNRNIDQRMGKLK